MDGAGLGGLRPVGAARAPTRQRGGVGSPGWAYGFVGGWGASGWGATCWGVWLHGEAGRRLAERLGMMGFLARELPGEVPSLMRGI